MNPSPKNILITVKAYPNPSQKYGETACCAGITDSGEWIRLYPIQYRDLPFIDRFAKYQWIKVQITKKKGDPRPESFAPQIDTLQLGKAIGTSKNWEERKKIVMPLLSPSMCHIQNEQSKRGISLGMFEPIKESVSILVEKEDSDWTSAQKSFLSQTSLFQKHHKSPLEKVPYRFKLYYYCNDPKCKSHNQTIIDWEIFALYRNSRATSANEEEAIEKVKDGYFRYAMRPDRKLYVYVGNQAAHPSGFLVLGAFYPPSK